MAPKNIKEWFEDTLPVGPRVGPRPENTTGPMSAEGPTDGPTGTTMTGTTTGTTTTGTTTGTMTVAGLTANPGEGPTSGEMVCFYVASETPSRLGFENSDSDLETRSCFF